MVGRVPLGMEFAAFVSQSVQEKIAKELFFNLLHVFLAFQLLSAADQELQKIAPILNR